MRGRSPFDRRGASSLGCLFSLLVFVGALYYGVNIGELFFRYYRLLDEMQSQAQLAPSLDDGTRFLIDRRAAARLPRRFGLTVRGFGRMKHLDLSLAGDQWGELLYT